MNITFKKTFLLYNSGALALEHHLKIHSFSFFKWK